MSIEGLTPTTQKIAILFVICVAYFIGEIHLFGHEYYVENPPYTLIGLIALASSALCFFILGKSEPERKDTLTFSLLILLGSALASYALIPRINILTDRKGLENIQYTLDSNNVWYSASGEPPVHVYLEHTRFWQQFKKGDSYIFQLRKGGLGIWLVDMNKVYEDQKIFYECDGIATCMFTNGFNFSE